MCADVCATELAYSFARACAFIGAYWFARTCVLFVRSFKRLDCSNVYLDDARSVLPPIDRSSFTCSIGEALTLLLLSLVGPHSRFIFASLFCKFICFRGCQSWVSDLMRKRMYKCSRSVRLLRRFQCDKSGPISLRNLVRPALLRNRKNEPLPICTQGSNRPIGLPQAVSLEWADVAGFLTPTTAVSSSASHGDAAVPQLLQVPEGGGASLPGPPPSPRTRIAWL